MQLPDTHLAVRQQQRELEQKIRLEGMLVDAGLAQPFHQWLMLRVGGVLVSAGRKLQERYEPALYFGSEATKQATGQTSA
jgi:hypothetical protein